MDDSYLCYKKKINVALINPHSYKTVWSSISLQIANVLHPPFRTEIFCYLCILLYLFWF